MSNPSNPKSPSDNELILRAARAITDLRKLAVALTTAGYPGHSIRLQGYAAVVKSLENELVEAQRMITKEVSVHSTQPYITGPQLNHCPGVYARRPTPSYR
ncbi:hypothetical protein PLANPX_3928 [Lacipirellula parvula]|uniref:Uncharacterized protein n=1 Tax=Lacipirellula parvula TaxID=2650471 RepID=A0A5K7XIY3_9BACT|nr:hypothetical protein PLANPX_3928 [Lacipirellula parvula]